MDGLIHQPQRQSGRWTPFNTRAALAFRETAINLGLSLKNKATVSITRETAGEQVERSRLLASPSPCPSASIPPQGEVFPEQHQNLREVFY